MRDKKISEILRDAADLYLWDGVADEAVAAVLYQQVRFCCHAISRVMSLPKWEVNDTPAVAFLEGIGMSTCGAAFQRTEPGGYRFEDGQERQSLRYAWLHFAADYAEELGK